LLSAILVHTKFNSIDHMASVHVVMARCASSVEEACPWSMCLCNGREEGY
jgi:hypothetical protein